MMPGPTTMKTEKAISPPAIAGAIGLSALKPNALPIPKSLDARVSRHVRERHDKGIIT
jgi:hypothetical protein